MPLPRPCEGAPFEPEDFEAMPFRARAVEPIPLPSAAARAAALERAGYNVFGLCSDEVSIDLLTDSGTCAMSAAQWAALQRGDEAYAGSRSFAALQAAVREHLGFDHVLPCHQGRGAERVAFAALLEPGDVVAGNAAFDTTAAHLAHRGALFVDCGVEAARDPLSDAPFKGDVDLGRLRAALDAGARAVLVTATCNTRGGHPVSLANLREVAAAARARGVPLWLDAARAAENAWLVKQREAGQETRPVTAVFRDLMDCPDLVLMSAKKGGLVHIGGLLAARTRATYDALVPHLVLHEGFPTYGGLAGRDLEALAVGLGEALDERFLRHRTGQVAALYDTLRAAGVPVVSPPGGHAVYLDASALLRHLPRHALPGIALVNALYLQGGVRAVEIGQVLEPGAPRDLVRLAVPARVYAQEHLDHVARVVAAVGARAEDVPGYRMVEKPAALAHFLARYAPVRG